jgi:hypothetical protein
VKLSRCGLVLNRNLPIDQVHATDEALYKFALAHWNEHLRKDLEKIQLQLQKNRFLTLGQARYHYGRSDKLTGFTPIMEKVSKLFE